MAQTRVVLDESDRPKAEAIMTQTGIKTFSQLLSILLINYGDHLVSALKATPTPPPPPVQMGVDRRFVSYSAAKTDVTFVNPFLGVYK